MATLVSVTSPHEEGGASRFFEIAHQDSLVGKLTRFDWVPALIGAVPEDFVHIGDMAWRPIQHRVTWRGTLTLLGGLC